MRKLLVALGVIELVRDVVACAIFGREPAWIERMRGVCQPPPFAEPVSSAWERLDARINSVVVGEA